jgi:hypothetical protein
MGDKTEADKEDLGKLVVGDADVLMAEVLKKLQTEEHKKLHDAEEALQKASVDGIYENPSPGTPS